MFSKIVLTSTLAAAVSAHQNFHQFWVNDVSPGFEVAIRPTTSNSPVTDVKSTDIICNVPNPSKPNADVAVADANEGDTIKVQWDSSTHPGPITHMLYGPVSDIKAVDSASATSWIKIDELDNVDGKWANEIMQAANMTHTFKLPAGLASGEYLLRSEMLALHGAQTVGGAQFYIGCAQLKITGSGDTCGAPSVELPGAYNAEDPNIYIPNVYNGFDVSTYTAPGGPVAACAGGSGSSAPKPSAAPGNGTALPSSAVAIPSLTLIASSAPSPTVPTTDDSTTAIPIASEAPASSATEADGTMSILPISISTSAAASPAKPTSAAPSTLATVVKPSAQSSAAAAAPTGSAGSGAVEEWRQCGGKGFSGATVCAEGLACKVQNEYYSQCVKA